MRKSRFTGSPKGPSLLNIMCTQRNGRDPFRVVISLIHNSNVLVAAALSGGLMFDAGVTGADAYSHTTKTSALLPRILAAYDALDSGARITAALAAVAALRRRGFDMTTVAESLRIAGWELRDEGFVVQSPETREMFFPKGSQWDAFVVLRDLFARANERITIVDSYCDTRVFQLLQERELAELDIRILCSRYAGPLAIGATAFMQQFPRRNC